jgi:DNA polymerase V
MSNEAKALGIRRGAPYFQIRSVCEQNGVYAFSGNHRLYGDMSTRVMATIASIVPEIEIYSIDECFMHFDGWQTDRLPEVGRDIVRRVLRNTGIPTSLGVAPTKTLAKIASKFAKKHAAYRCVCMIDTDEKRRKALALTHVEDVWGIGRRLAVKMHAAHIDTALQLADLPKERISKMLNITGERTWRELNGEPCVGVESDTGRKQICCSRSFGKAITDFDQLSEAVAAFTAIAARKLRQQRGCAASISVFIHTNAFREDQEQYYNSALRTLDEATNDTMTLTAAAVEALKRIYRRGYSFKKAGVMITEIIDESKVQPSLFGSAEDRERRAKLMSVVDRINSGSMARDTVHVATQAPIDSCVRSEKMSRQYSTRLSDVIIVNTP